MSELKPCPFCGSGAYVIGFESSPLPTMYAVVCRSCHAGTNNRTTAEGAAEAWNRRVDNE